MKIIKEVKKIKQNGKEFILNTNCVPIKIIFLTSNIVRIRAGFEDDAFPESSYSLMTTAWDDEMDHMLMHKRTRIEAKAAVLSEDDKYYYLQGKKLKINILKIPFQISIYNEKNICIYADVSGISYQKDSNNRVLHYSEIEQDDCFYGFGEKSGPLNKIRRAMKMSSKDAMGYDAEETDGLYKHIPFYIKLNRKSKTPVGLFYHNTYECLFDMGKEKSNYWHYYSKYIADGGDIDLFIINGDNFEDIVSRYTDLTGKSAMLPIHALGYLGSSMYYPELEANCDDEIIEFIKTNQKEGIPIDNFHLSSGYTVQENNKRCTFTWNTERFKDPQKFFKLMEECGVSTIPNVKPHGILISKL